MPLTHKQQAIEMLREFATHQGTGFRGIIRMKRMQADAVALLAKIDKAKAKPRKKQTFGFSALSTTGWFAEALRKHNGEVVDVAGFNEIFKEISLNNLAKVLPEFSWVDLREWALEMKWFAEIGPGKIRIKVPKA